MDLDLSLELVVGLIGLVCGGFGGLVGELVMVPVGGRGRLSFLALELVAVAEMSDAVLSRSWGVDLECVRILRVVGLPLPLRLSARVVVGDRDDDEEEPRTAGAVDSR